MITITLPEWLMQVFIVLLAVNAVLATVSVWLSWAKHRLDKRARELASD